MACRIHKNTKVYSVLVNVLKQMKGDVKKRNILNGEENK